MPSWISGDVVANDIRIHYHRTGGDKPPLVLSHGITDNGLCWTRTAQALERDYDVIMVDARGHGYSDAPEAGYTPDDRADDLAGFIRALGLEKPHLAGHSMGADTTAVTAATYPGLVGSTILEDPPWHEGSLPVEHVAEMVEEWRTKIAEAESMTLEESTAVGRERHPEWAEVELAPWAEAKSQVSPSVIDVIAGLRPDWREICARISCPTLLITGDPALGGIVTPQVAAEAVHHCPYLRVAHIEGAGHSIHRDHFEQFVDVVTQFLAQVPA